jgi:RimJ/RimL family protein N-acetyltransferase
MGIGISQGTMKIREHTISLYGEKTSLRPLTEDDWNVLLKWNSDPAVLYYVEGDNITSRDLPDIQNLYRDVSQNAFCFMAEIDHIPIGECWLQQMNLNSILSRYPGKDCRRIDMLIGEKHYWGNGFGTEIIGMLTRFGFNAEKADFLFGCDIGDYNPRSLKAFKKNGFRLESKIEQPYGCKARFVYDLVLSKKEYLKRQQDEQGRQ